MKLKLERVLCWISKYDILWSLDFCNLINELFVEVWNEMSCLVELGNFVVVDDIVKRILRFLVVWGGEIFEYFKIKFFFCE